MIALLSLLLGAACAADVPPAADRPAAGAFAPFDLTYMPRATHSVIAVRPGELLKHLGEQDKFAADMARRFLAAAFAFLDGDLKAAAPPAVADIDQLILSAQITLGIETEKEGRSNFGVNGVSSGLVRTAKPFDWAGRLKKWFPKAETAKHAGREYVRVPFGTGERTTYLALFVADDRTLAFDSDEAEMKWLLDRLDKKQKPVAPAGWDEVSRDLVALCHDTAADGWLRAPEKPKRECDQALVTLGRKATGVALGFSSGDRTDLRVVATARDEDAAREVRTALKAIVAQLSDEDEVGRAAAKLFAGTTVNRDGAVVRAKGSVPGNLLRRLLDPDAER
jgi:hypothetical protein